jgi:hypothetical protein
MKKYIIVFALMLTIPVFIAGQTTDPLTSKCAMNTGAGTAFLKDFRVQLRKGVAQPELRLKQPYAMSKNMKYRFTLCNADNSAGQLIMKIKDDQGKLILSTYDTKSGKTFPSVDFQCNKSGTYQIYFDFVDYQQGLGVGIVSLVK